MSARRFVPIADWVRVYGRPMRVAILERRSKDDPDTKSLQVQHDTCLRWLNSLPAGSWSCDLRLAEDGGDVYRQIVSAWRGKGNHRLLQQIMARLTEYDVVVVYRIDRFGRNVVTVLTTLDQMREAGVRLYSVEENLDTADPSQQFNSQLFAMLAQHSSDLTSARIRGNKQRAKDLGGWRGGSITYGYRKAVSAGPDGEPVPVLDVNGYKTLEHDPAEVAHLREAVRLVVDEGLSMSAVVRRFNGDGVPSPRGHRVLPDGTFERILWTTTGLKRILANPALQGFDVVGVGEDRFQIHYVDGRPHRPHPPILTDERWHALQRSLGARGGPRRHAQEALLAGLVRCGGYRVDGQVCGRVMYGPGTMTANSASYTCRTSNNLAKDDPNRCTGNSVSAKNLHLLVEAVLRGIAADPRWPAALQAAYAKQAAQAVQHAAGDELDVESETATLIAQMSDLRAERDHAKSAARRQQISADIERLDERLAALENAVPSPRVTALAEAALPTVSLMTRWQSMPTNERRQVLTALIERITLLPYGGPAAQRGRTFDPSRVQIELRNVGTFHLTDPVDTRPASVACPECGQSFGEGSALGVHRRHKHGVAGATARAGVAVTRYACPEESCDLTTTSAGGLHRHMTVVHGPRRAFLCGGRGCGRTFAAPADLGSHVQQQHRDRPDEGPEVCTVCGVMFRGSRGLRIHTGRMHPIP